MKRTDPLTQEVFIPKRSNQWFASRENQIKYNNLKAKEKRNIKSEIDSILDKNRSVLEQLYESEDLTTYTKDKMRFMGFNFNCYTHGKILNEKNYAFIYEYGYSPINNEIYDIIKHA